VLCKHEVVGSIPSGSTSLHSRSEQGCDAGARWAKAEWLSRASAREADCCPKIAAPNWVDLTISSARTSLRMRRSLQGPACGIYDIVKRRSIRVWDSQSNLRIPIIISGTFRRSRYLQGRAGCKCPLLVRPDRFIIGLILRSKLVFLISVLPQYLSIRRGCAL
jgi:hypothetical protein